MLTSTTIGVRCALSRSGSRLLMQQALSQLSQTQLQQVFRTNGPPQQQDPESHGRTTLSTMEARQGRAQQQYKQPSPSRLGYLMLQHGMSHIGCAPRGTHQQAYVRLTNKEDLGYYSSRSRTLCRALHREEEEWKVSTVSSENIFCGLGAPSAHCQCSVTQSQGQSDSSPNKRASSFPTTPG